MNFVSGGGPAQTADNNSFRRFNYPKYYKNSQFYNVPDAELRRMAAGISEQIYGDMGIVAEAPATTTTTTTQNAKTGGVRQYVSRLGELKSARATKAKL
jgi:hypothetical protein